MRSLTKILRDASTLWPLYVGVIITSLTTAGLALVTPFIIRTATDTIVASISGQQSAPDAMQVILWLAAALLAAEIAHSLVFNIGGYLGDVLAARLKQILSTRYFAKLLSLPQQYFDKQVTGTIVARLDRSVNSVTQCFQAFTNNFFPMLLTVAAVLGITAWYYWPIAVLLAIVFPVYMWLTTMTSTRWQTIEGEKNKNIDIADGRFAEVIGQTKTVKSFVTELLELGSFARRYGNTIGLTRTQSKYWHRMDFLRGAALNILFFGIYALLFTRTLSGHFSIGDMVMLIQLVTMARQPVFMMSYLVDISQRAIAGSKDYFEVMSTDPEPTADPQLVAATATSDVPQLRPTPLEPLPPAEPVLELNNVSFGYPGDKEVIHGVSFVARRGQRIALVGESGGGKSTLVNLILGLYAPSSGELKVCGQDVKQLSASKLRASVGVVFQEASLFSGTIRENIAYGKPHATQAEVIAAAQRANAHDFIVGFEDGYDTVVGERGVRLSGGQKQRIAVARAMLKDAPVLVLDEATSALDTRSELAVQQGLDELMADRTTLIIAHRLSTIAGVDTIVTLRDGHIDEIGSPQHLATTGGIYAQLLALTDAEQLKAFELRS
ncbi:ABC transporter ATP-binding protein [Corynebacterium sp.]|uniref:ABC transporter ATP-binding protein n=1 Tax=Corynebacterium sp. TaxID=1720 RepID=UPI0026DDC2ED|nr:ABC transporter ATP-binding protein [Corynebacterium sp.]MDO5076066.1 ABC transporter ATP-binding protein [Corynebacterium sp.]